MDAPRLAEEEACRARPVGAVAQARLDARGLSKLKWRCRRGLLENDLFIERFFGVHEADLTVGHAWGLHMLMDLADNDLLDLLLKRKEPGAETTEEVREVLEMLRSGRHVSCGGGSRLRDQGHDNFKETRQ
ncbi:MAG: succinate dehydrogenase assembly factor 2 [Betaproteobacteria bacterium HGW-Betaproteobacteria-3]|jgi:antitoxin CptB|nr:MAG: succinate dehydrogenase assembly factor 2 [Betaproteobacteria bacterium HGW-Betaproteobacteria-3]